MMERERELVVVLAKTHGNDSDRRQQLVSQNFHNPNDSRKVGITYCTRKRWVGKYMTKQTGIQTHPCKKDIFFHHFLFRHSILFLLTFSSLESHTLSLCKYCIPGFIFWKYLFYKGIVYDNSKLFIHIYHYIIYISFIYLCETSFSELYISMS